MAIINLFTAPGITVFFIDFQGALNEAINIQDQQIMDHPISKEPNAIHCIYGKNLKVMLLSIWDIKIFRGRENTFNPIANAIIHKTGDVYRLGRLSPKDSGESAG